MRLDVSEPNQINETVRHLIS